MIPNLLIEPHYFGGLEFFCLVAQSETITLDIHHHFMKQTYRNRCQIMASAGVQVLSVPVSYRNHTPLREVKIDHSQSWARDHWGAIYSAYGKAPFFEFFADYLALVISKKYTYLIDLTVDSLTVCLNLLKLKKKIEFTERYLPKDSEGFFDVRDQLSAKHDRHSSAYYRPISYPQIFGKDFVQNLSILDLLLCEGSEAGKILIKSIKIPD